ncbi:DUF3106 domain-containing protein [Variovorax sp. UC122_21]|uniref:DUF3106 domain-containing protein n=1 Tax=Variovorax sp. UC122_21 TaxID=3374554 RepID=UPI00375838BC
MPRRTLLPAISPRSSRSWSQGAVVRLGGVGIVAMAALGLTIAAAQTTPVRSETVRADTPKAAPTGTMAASAAAKPPVLTKPLWAELTAEQQQALQPLAPHWNALNVGQKRKWLALSRNYASLPAEDQITLRSRMIEWAALSNQQRVQARLNFAEVKRVPADERKAKWEQYQALSEEEKRKLAERAPAKPKGAAIPVRPVSSQKLVAVPAVTSPGLHTPRIQLAPPMAPAAPAIVPAAALAANPPTAATGTATATTAPASSSTAAPAGYTPQPVPAEAQVPSPYSSSPGPSTSVSSTPSSTSAGRTLEPPSAAP